MGMIDYVNYEFECPLCGNFIFEFQTKTAHVVGDEDRDPFGKTFQPWEVEEFAGWCDKCKKLYEFRNERLIPMKEPEGWKDYIKQVV
jgi:hypothetical protein